VDLGTPFCELADNTFRENRFAGLVGEFRVLVAFAPEEIVHLFFHDFAR
jgi:hypothetical protein